MKWAFLLIFLPSGLYSQNIKVSFDDELRNIETGHSLIPLWEYTGDTIYYRSQAHHIVLPENLKKGTTAMGLEYFAGWENAPIEDNVLIVIENYLSPDRKIYVAYNNNLNITDDGPPVSANEAGKFKIILHNSTDPGAKFGLELQKADYDSENSKENAEDFFMNHRNYLKNKLAASGYWMFVVRLNTKWKETSIQGKPIKIGLRDGSCNGFFNDSGHDHICIAEGDNALSSSKSKGAVEWADTNTLVKIYGQVYEVAEIEKTGKSITLTPTNKKLDRLSAGDLVPDLMYYEMGDDSSYIYADLKAGEYNLIYIWGSWCKPCTYKLPQIKALYDTGLNILGLNYGDNEEGAKSYIEKHEIKWKNGFISREILNQFYVDSWPYFVLIDKDKHIVQFHMPLEEVEKMVKQ